MKAGIIDIIWSVVSMIVLAVFYLKGYLIYGLLIIYAMMFVIFYIHILKIRKSISDSIAVYGKITGYHTTKTGKGFCPVVKYTTEDGREITSVYTIVERKKRYETGTEIMICYDPENPMSFYFTGREDDLTSTYYRFIITGGIISAILLVLSQIK